MTGWRAIPGRQPRYWMNCSAPATARRTPAPEKEPPCDGKAGSGTRPLILVYGRREINDAGSFLSKVAASQAARELLARKPRSCGCLQETGGMLLRFSILAHGNPGAR